MWKYILKRLGMAAATLFVILFILYCLLEFMPGSPFNELELTAAQMARLYEKYGLDKPFLQRFFIYVGNMLRGDFGVSYNIQQDYPVVKLISSKFLVSARIGLIAVAIGTVIGILFGMIAAVKKNTWLDSGTTFISVIGVSLPGYVFALGLSYFIGYKLKLLPLVYSNKHVFLSSIMPVMCHESHCTHSPVSQYRNAGCTGFGLYASGKDKGNQHRKYFYQACFEEWTDTDYYGGRSHDCRNDVRLRCCGTDFFRTGHGKPDGNSNPVK